MWCLAGRDYRSGRALMSVEHRPSKAVHQQIIATYSLKGYREALARVWAGEWRRRRRPSVVCDPFWSSRSSPPLLGAYAATPAPHPPDGVAQKRLLAQAIQMAPGAPRPIVATPDFAAAAAATADAPARRHDEPEFASFDDQLEAPNPEPLNGEQLVQYCGHAHRGTPSFGFSPTGYGKLPYTAPTRLSGIGQEIIVAAGPVGAVERWRRKGGRQLSTASIRPLLATTTGRFGSHTE